MEGFGGLFGDPEELQRRMAEFAEQMQGQQRLAWADNAIKLAVDMTVAAINRINLQGNAEQQAQQIRAVMALVFPEAVTLVREAREGFSSALAGVAAPSRRRRSARAPEPPAAFSRAAARARPARVDHLLEGAEAEDER